MRILLAYALAIHVFWMDVALANDSDPLQTLKTGHPRLLATADEFNQLAKSDDPLRAEVLKRILATADKELHAPLLIYKIEPGDAHLLKVSRAAFQRIALWSMAYRLSHEARFANRAKQEMINVSAFPDWSPDHFLDTGEIAMAVAIGYDWCYDTLNPDERATIKNALMEKALSFAPAAYGPVAPGEKRDKRVHRWVEVNYNWNQVGNGGMLAAALAIADEEPDTARLVINGARASLPLAMHSYAPDGAWPEGPGYWAYGTTFNVLALAMMESALGTDLGLAKVEPAFAKTAAFRLQMDAPDGVIYNYADVSTTWETIPTPAFGWLAQRYGPPVAVAHLRDSLAQHFAKIAGNKETDRFFPFYALWLPPAPAQMTPAPLDTHFSGLADVAVFRSAWNDPDALYLGFKAGTNGVNHGHLDLGSFLFDSDGVRWSAELGSDSYNLPAYFGAKRWTYYRLNNYSQSTLTPGTQLQDPKASAPIFAFSSTPDLASATADLTAAYPSAASRILRGVFVFNRSRALVQDEITGLAAGTPLHWRMMTPAKINISADGHSATLTQRDKTLRVEILSPNSATFSIESAAPPTAIENQNLGYSVLLATVPAVGTTSNQRVAVLLTPAGSKWPASQAAPPLVSLPAP